MLFRLISKHSHSISAKTHKRIWSTHKWKQTELRANTHELCIKCLNRNTRWIYDSARVVTPPPLPYTIETLRKAHITNRNTYSQWINIIIMKRNFLFFRSVFVYFFVVFRNRTQKNSVCWFFVWKICCGRNWTGFLLFSFLSMNTFNACLSSQNCIMLLFVKIRISQKIHEMNLFFSFSCVFFLRDTLCMKLSLYTLCLYSVWIISISSIFSFACTHNWSDSASSHFATTNFAQVDVRLLIIDCTAIDYVFFCLLLLVLLLLLCVRLSLHGWVAAVLVRILTDCLAGVLVCVCAC